MCVHTCMHHTYACIYTHLFSVCVCVRVCVCVYSHNLKYRRCLVFADIYRLHSPYTCQRVSHPALTNTFQRRNLCRFQTLLHLYIAPQHRLRMALRLAHGTRSRTCSRIELCLLQGCGQNRPDMPDSPTLHHCQKYRGTCPTRSRHSR